MTRPSPSPIELHRQLQAVWATRPGWQRLAAVNHTTLGIRFMVTAVAFFLLGGLLAMLIRIQLATARSPFMEEGLYAQIFTMHGTIMMFLFAIPLIEGMAIYLLPKLLGARDLAFPRLTAYGYWCYLLGGLILVGALAAGLAPDSGWFMYPPLSSAAFSPGINADVWLLGVTFVEISALCAAVEITVSILKVRAPGMSLDRLPILAWYMLVVAAMMLAAFPPLIVGSVLLELERAFGLPFFDPQRGGDPLLWQHLFWLFGHPEVYIIFLPAAGAISTFLPVLAGVPLAGYRAVIVAVIALGFLSMGLWVHHMFTVGIPHLALGLFSAASALVAIPTAVQIFAWLATLARGRPRAEIPMLYFGGFLFTFVAGGLTGVMVAMVPFDWQAHDTHFIVAHLHHVLVGGFVFPMIGAAYYWMPHLTGRLPLHHWAKPAFWLIFAGFNLTFLPMHLTGLRGMPRRVHEYPPEPGMEALNLLSSAAGFLMAIGFALVVLDLFVWKRFGERFRRNPWKAGTLEWAMPTPPTAYGFASLPHVETRADGLDPARLGADLAAGRGYLGFVRDGAMETLGVSAASGNLEQVVILPKPSYAPLWSALATGGFFLSLLMKQYWLAPVFLAATGLSFLAWTRGGGETADRGDIDAGMGVAAPSHHEAPNPPSRLAMVLALAADAVAFVSLLFGGLFLWISAPGWPPPTQARLDLSLALPAATALAVAFAGSRHALANTAGRPVASIAAAGLGQAAACVLLAALAADATPLRHVHAAHATLFAILAYCALHCAIAVLFAVHGISRVLAGKVSPRRSNDLRLVHLFNAYSAAAGLAGLASAFALAEFSLLETAR